MNTVRKGEIDDGCFNKTEAPRGDQNLLILVRSNNLHLIGIFQGYCHFAGCKMKTLPCSNNVDIFFKTLKTESPSMVFIDMEQAAQIVNSPEWPAPGCLCSKTKLYFVESGNIQPTIMKLWHNRYSIKFLRNP